MRRYRAVRSFLEGTLIPDRDVVITRKPSDLLRELILTLENKKPGFRNTLKEIVTRKMHVRHWMQAILVLSVLCVGSFFITVGDDSELQRFKNSLLVAKVALPFLLGIGVASIYHLIPREWEEIKLFTSFFFSLVEVLWEVAKYEHGMQYEKFPRRIIRRILLEWDIQDFNRSVDRMLVSLAFEVKKLEPERVETDPELRQTRDRFKFVHGEAVKLEVAEKNPKTYFDRAVPASAVTQPITVATALPS
ncbi:MAG: hypothetical protein Q7R64_01115 [bacterium]|nr:hypothetical protein [bacterium]